MEKLSMQDASFLYAETENVMNHIASLQQFQLPKDTSPQAFIESLKDYLSDRIHLLPYLTRKVQMIPGGIDHAVWVQDGTFDINHHVVEVPIEAPGDFEQVQKKVAELHSSPMDRNLPLWRFHIMTGLEDGTVAYYAQVHHACVDGMAGQALTLTLTDKTEVPEAKNCPDEYLQSENPSIAELLSSSFQNLFNYQLRSFDRANGMAKTLTSLTQRAIDPSKSFGALTKQAPKTRFNRTVNKTRAYACTSIPLDDVKKIGKVMGASVNDVFLTICSGALRRYLERTDELPQQSLLAGCPVAVPRQGHQDQGNSVSLMSVDLSSDIADPRVRLLKIVSSSNTAKEVTAELADSMESNISMFGLPAMTRATSMLSEATGATNNLPTPFNVVVSNVPGPRETLYSNGAKMLSHYPVSIPAHGVGLNITVQSYNGTLFVGFTACEKAVSDISQLKDDLTAAYKELKGLVIPATVSDISAKKVPAAQADTELAANPDHTDPQSDKQVA